MPFGHDISIPSKVEEKQCHLDMISPGCRSSYKSVKFDKNISTPNQVTGDTATFETNELVELYLCLLYFKRGTSRSVLNY